MVIRISHCYFIVYYYILGVHQLSDWPSLVYSPRHCEIQVLSASHAHNFCAWLLIILSQLPSCIIVNYMVTVFIRYLLLFSLCLLSCSKCFVCLRLFQHRHCFLVGASKSYVILIATSNLWLFIHASNLLPSIPTLLPYTHTRTHTHTHTHTHIYISCALHQHVMHSCDLIFRKGHKWWCTMGLVLPLRHHWAAAVPAAKVWPWHRAACQPCQLCLLPVAANVVLHPASRHHCWLWGRSTLKSTSDSECWIVMHK